MSELQAIIGEEMAKPWLHVASSIGTDGNGWFEEDEATYLVDYVFCGDIRGQAQPSDHVRQMAHALWPRECAAADAYRSQESTSRPKPPRG